MWADNLADTLRAAGLTVRESPGWKRYGHGPMKAVRGVMLHHTAGGAPYDRTVVIDGRPGLPGPLANLYLDPGGVWWAVAGGRAYHAGAGGPWGNVPRDQGNDYTLGVEVSSLGASDITGTQYDAMVKGSAAIVKAFGLTAAHVLTHKDWTSRKVDIRNPIGTVRVDVASALNPTPTPIPAPIPEDDDMAAILIKGDVADAVYSLNTMTGLRRHVPYGEFAARTGAGEKLTTFKQSVFDSIPKESGSK